MRPVTAEAELAEVVVDEVDGVGVESQVNAPAASVAPLLERQKVIVVLAPFAITDPFNVAEVAPIEDGSFVVAAGGPATIVKVRFLPAEVVG